MSSLKELIILDEIADRFMNEKKYGTPVYNNETELSYISVHVGDLELTRNIEKRIWKMPEFYGVISTWCDIQSKCRITFIQFVV